MKIKEGCLLRTVGGVHIVIPTEDMMIDFKAMAVVNDVTASVWDFLKVDKSREEILEHILSVYEIDRATAEEDMDELIAQMEENGLLENINTENT